MTDSDVIDFTNGTSGCRYLAVMSIHVDVLDADGVM